MKTTKVMIFDSYSDDIFSIPETPDEFLSFWKTKFDLIPKEFRSTAKIEYDAESDYDVPYLIVELSYKRPENKEELARRVEAEDKRKANIRQHELKQLAELKEKYGEI